MRLRMPRMLRHARGYAVATKRHDPRTIQDCLGHWDPKHTAFDNPNRGPAVWEPVASNGMSETRKPAEWSLLVGAVVCLLLRKVEVIINGAGFD